MKRFKKLLSVCLLAALPIAGCTTHGLFIDKSHHAQGQSQRIEYLVLHYTAENDANSLAVLTQGEVSSHYLISSGDTVRVYQLVDDDKKAWHAGVSHFRGKSSLNDISIGIEIVNDGVASAYRGHRGYLPNQAYVAYGDEQIRQLAKLLRSLSDKYDIAPENIVGHSDIAPSRKIDPGAKFPWEYLYRNYGIGAWYDETDKADFLDKLTDADLDTANVPSIKAQLRHYGYQINDNGEWDKASQDVVYAFQLHFRPDNPTGVMDAETLAILQALNKKYRPSAN
ncbi:N-acetylmuramoyl-L-alanine amidase [Moraxella marmotae]|uniref:N-acetylmuramoyl-L-alanine amidase n=1 Tax=Moraxella marmotae TaxID=3344520 RepID=UPI0035F34662